ncbi:MAG: glutamine amidotransferase [Bacteroidetes bacterium]|nr:MAG: glutamine amidotransferase [Bacteroidota bacterium]
MSKKSVYVFLFDGFSDWELGYVMPELRKSRLYDLKTFSFDGNSIVSMGGFSIQPDISMGRVDISDMAMLILPGGDAWEEHALGKIVPLVQQVNGANIPIAAICGATVIIADMGFLNDIAHTSNAREYLKAVAPAYKGENNYSESRAVNQANIITASGIAPIEFAREIFKELKLYEDQAIESWYQLFRNGIWIG